ncbi:hypothetical protein BpHYR1_005358 [Brachionus plicatilis]|uniref:Uncharacterized protein n=1 Tax=Brachionus plicatilis TaxID=10195 RepID=A0A3M7R4K1_BRAPC|nr:hypothetical protein BpHYR1_005358 [Brachionus plicatilis]
MKNTQFRKGPARKNRELVEEYKSAFESRHIEFLTLFEGALVSHKTFYTVIENGYKKKVQLSDSLSSSTIFEINESFLNYLLLKKTFKIPFYFLAHLGDMNDKGYQQSVIL